jgi:hypothetical protein
MTKNTHTRGNKRLIIYINKTQGRSMWASAYSVFGFRTFNSQKADNGSPTSAFGYTVDTMAINRVVPATVHAVSYYNQTICLPTKTNTCSCIFQYPRRLQRVVTCRVCTSIVCTHIIAQWMLKSTKQPTQITFFK